MTNGSSQGLFVIVAVVVFGIFVLISYMLFGSQLKPQLASIYCNAFEITSENTGFGTGECSVESDVINNENLYEIGDKNNLYFYYTSQAGSYAKFNEAMPYNDFYSDLKIRANQDDPTKDLVFEGTFDIYTSSLRDVYESNTLKIGFDNIINGEAGNAFTYNQNSYASYSKDKSDDSQDIELTDEDFELVIGGVKTEFEQGQGMYTGQTKRISYDQLNQMFAKASFEQTNHYFDKNDLVLSEYGELSLELPEKIDMVLKFKNVEYKGKITITFKEHAPIM